MKVLVVCEPGQVMLIGEGGWISGIVEGPLNTTGNPYILFGPIIQDHFPYAPFVTDIVVATVTSGYLDQFNV